EIEGDFGSTLAEFARVLPHRDGLGAEGDAVERGMVAVLTRDGHGTGKTLSRQGRNGATSSAVIGGNDSIDLVVVGGQELLHVALGNFGVPVVCIGFTDID